MEGRGLVTIGKTTANSALPVAPFREQGTESCNFIPRTSRNVIDRVRLTARLNNPSNHALTLVVAPAGFGKTTLLTAWVRDYDHRVAWLSVEERDEGLQRFIFCIVTAFRQAVNSLVPNFGAGWLRTRSLQSEYHWKQEVSLIIQELYCIPTPVTLIIDDYQFVVDDRIHQFVNELIQKLPEAINVIISSRRTPPLPISKLRASGLLTEINTEQLRFTNEETADFFNKIVQVELSPKEIVDLNRHAEGWIVGLQLAAIGIQDGARISDLLNSVSRSRRHSLVYLLEEVLHRQPVDIQTFLIHTSILDKFNSSLCDQVADVKNSAEIISRLRSENIFIVVLDDTEQWFRFHYLFRSLLREQLDVVSPDLVVTLERRACAWYEEAEMIPEAVVHAVNVSDWDHVVNLVKPAAAPLLLQTRDFRDWLRTLPNAAFDGNNTLAVFLAIATLIGGNVRTCKRMLSKLEKKISKDDPLLLEVLVMRSTIGWYAREFVSGFQSAQMLIDSPIADITARYMGVGALGQLYSASGNNYLAADCLNEALSNAISAGTTSGDMAMRVIGTQARILWSSGRLNAALQTVNEMDNRAASTGYRPPVIGPLVKAHVYLERYELAAAEEELALAAESIRQTGVETTTQFCWDGYIILRLARQDFAGAASAINELSEWCRRNGNEGWVRITETYRANLLLAQDRFQELEPWLDEHASLNANNIDIDDEPRHLILAKWVLRTKSVTKDEKLMRQASELAGSLGKQARVGGRILDAAHADIVQALLNHKLNHKMDALRIVNDVASQLLPEFAIWPFLCNVDLLQPMLADAKSHYHLFPHLAALEVLLSQTHQPVVLESPAQIDHLVMISEREKEILNLIAIGLTNVEIAESLVVSLNTVKTHVKNIYFKLSAHSRTQAIAAARNAGLL